MSVQKHRNALTLLLLTVSLLALAPALTTADQQAGTISINATGIATPLNKGKGVSSSATLVLNGTVYAGENGQLKIQGLTGLLQIGSTDYAVSGGQGEVNNKGQIQVNVKLTASKEQLILHGNMQGDNVIFDSPESKLASLYFLSLSGQSTINVNTSSSSSKSKSEGGNAVTTVTETVTQTDTSFVTQNYTTTQNVTQTLNNTITNTEYVNQTTTQTVTVPGNVTVTTTQLLNQTITVTETQTVANVTITQTLTTTVANTTITTTLTNSTTPP